MSIVSINPRLFVAAANFVRNAIKSFGSSAAHIALDNRYRKGSHAVRCCNTNNKLRKRKTALTALHTLVLP